MAVQPWLRLAKRNQPRRLLLLLIILALAVPPIILGVVRASIAAPLSVQYQIEPGDQPDNHLIDFQIKLTNISDQGIRLNTILVRYWYTLDAPGHEESVCFYPSGGCHATSYKTYSAVPGADRVVDLGAAGDNLDVLDPGENVEFDIYLQKVRSQDDRTPVPYDETDDYSYDASKSFYADWDRVAVYLSGRLVWGTEPAGVNGPTPESNAGLLTLQYARDASHSQPDDPRIEPWLWLTNTSTITFSLRDLTLRYWYTRDDPGIEESHCHALPHCDEAVMAIYQLASPVPGADSYLELGFPNAAGSSTIPPGQGVDLRFSIHKYRTDGIYTTYQELDDYSYDGDESRTIEDGWGYWDRITVYLDGRLVWGVEPVTMPDPTLTACTTPTEVSPARGAADNTTVSIVECTVPQTGPTANGLSHITVGPDGALWFTQQSSSRIGRLQPDGPLTNFSLPSTERRPHLITTGPDGSLWFTDVGNNSIGRMTTTGVLTDYPLPYADSGPGAITTGPDGALWFTMTRRNAIGRITTNGSLTEFLLPTVGSDPYGITAGPDGALWFTERAGNKIGRMTTNGQITEYPLLTAASEPHDITLAPDGALWFTQRAANTIGRMTATGVLIEYRLPDQAAGPRGLTIGPDQALWFAASDGNTIGRLTLLGLVSTYAVPTADSRPWSITRAPDGTLWFTEKAADQIGRLRPGAFPTPTPTSSATPTSSTTPTGSATPTSSAMPTSTPADTQPPASSTPVSTATGSPAPDSTPMSTSTPIPGDTIAPTFSSSATPGPPTQSVPKPGPGGTLVPSTPPQPTPTLNGRATPAAQEQQRTYLPLLSQ